MFMFINAVVIKAYSKFIFTWEQNCSSQAMEEIIMDSFTYKTNGVCSKEINISIENGVLTNVSFKSGCNGNLQGIGRLVQGMTVDDVINKLEGINCNGKVLHADQLSKALKEHILKTRGQ